MNIMICVFLATSVILTSSLTIGSMIKYLAVHSMKVSNDPYKKFESGIVDGYNKAASGTEDAYNKAASGTVDAYSKAANELKEVFDVQSNSCSCQNYSCSCCLQIVVQKISLNETGCVNITYLVDEYGFEFVLTLNGKVIIDEKVSAKNPPPICAPIPYSQQVASICIRFYNLDYKDKQFSGCVDIEVDLEGVVIKKFDLGCIHIPPGEKHSLNGSQLSRPDPLLRFSGGTLRKMSKFVVKKI